MSGDVVRAALLGVFRLYIGSEEVRVPLGVQRLISFLALQDDQSAPRSVVAENLWPESRTGRATANLRSAIWNGRTKSNALLFEGSGQRIALPGKLVRVDYLETVGRSRQIMGADLAMCELDGREVDELNTLLSRPLLPDWSEEWLLVERERWNQVRVNTLEVLSTSLTSAGRYLSAIEAALSAIAIEPLRESSHRTVIQAYIAQGNAACALQHYQRFRGLVRRELGVAPSHQLNRLVQSLVTT